VQNRNFTDHFNEDLVSFQYILMKKLLSTQYNSISFNIAMLTLRLFSGILMMSHGYEKLLQFSEKKAVFHNFLGIGAVNSLLLVIFAEFFCALFLMIGLFTRLVAFPLIIVMSVAVFEVHQMDFFQTGEKASLFLSIFITLLLCGPGKASIDGIAGK
jgi:putative oxidoreductase